MIKVGNSYKTGNSLKLTVILTIIFTLCSSLVIPNEQAFAATTKKTNATVTSAKLNVRSGAGTNYKIVGYLKKGTKVTVYSKKKTGWTEIHFKSNKAYVATKYLKFSSKKDTVTIPKYKDINELAQKIRNVTGAEVRVDSGALAVLTGRSPVLVYAYGSRRSLMFIDSEAKIGIAAKTLSLLTGSSSSALCSSINTGACHRPIYVEICRI